jgi:methyltransferase
MELKMPLSVMLFLALLLAVAALRIFELRISKRHQQRMTSRGAAKVKDPYFRWMAMFHTLVLIGAAAEVVFLRRPLLPALAAPMVVLFLTANLVRWWVIRTLGEHWNVQVVDSTKLGFVASGPFRYVRHPNYAAVFVEMIALPLIHAAWITALAGAVAHIIVLSLRLSVEDPVLLSNPDYAATMGSKPRFLPGLF